jgi:hypothetical protein
MILTSYLYVGVHTDIEVACGNHMNSLMMALVRRNMYERLTKHHNKVIILMHLLVFCADMTKYLCIVILGSLFLA